MHAIKLRKIGNSVHSAISLLWIAPDSGLPECLGFAVLIINQPILISSNNLGNSPTR